MGNPCLLGVLGFADHGIAEFRVVVDCMPTKERNCFIKGFKVATQPAVMPMPTSTVVHIAISAVRQRKSPLYFFAVQRYGMRMMVAALPLLNLLAYGTRGGTQAGSRKTYTAAKPKIAATMTLTDLFICKSLTMKIGSTPKTQSATEFNADIT